MVLKSNLLKLKKKTNFDLFGKTLRTSTLNVWKLIQSAVGYGTFYLFTSGLMENLFCCESSMLHKQEYQRLDFSYFSSGFFFFVYTFINNFCTIREHLSN